MASPENVASMMEPWAFRPAAAFADSWISEAFARDTKTLTRALQKSLSNNNNPEQPFDASSDAAFMPFLNDLIGSETAPTPTGSGLSGSDDLDASAAPPPKRQQRSAIPVAAAGGKVTKRKSRASKRSQTTFITADPSNFRQMVQQVTGVRFGGGPVTLPEILKPEPQRLLGRFPASGCGMPTLDTSAFLLDRHNQQQQQQQMAGTAMTSVGELSMTLTGPGSVSFGQTSVGGDVASGGGVGAGGLGFESCSSFPTLESWKVM